ILDHPLSRMMTAVLFGGTATVSRDRDWEFQFDLFSGARRLDRRGADLEVGETPAAGVGHGFSGDGLRELLNHQIARALVLRQRDLLTALVRIDQEPVRR